MSRSERARSILKPLVLACLLVCGTLSLLELSGVQYSVTTHRVTHLKALDAGSSLIIPMSILLAVWVILYLEQGADLLLLTPLAGLILLPLLGLASAVTMASISASIVGLFRWRCWSDVVLWILSIFASFEALALIHWFLLPLGSTPFLNEVSTVESDIYYLLSTLALIPIFALFFGWLLNRLRNMHPEHELNLKQSASFTKYNWALLVFSLGVAAFAGVYPYLGSVNPHGLLVGYDVTSYLDAAKQVFADPSNVFKVMGGQRPVVFGVIYLIQRITGAGELSILVALPSLLLTLLAASSTLLAWEAFRDGDTAAFAAFFSACGVFTIESIYGFFLANMFAIIFTQLWLALLFMALRTRSHLVFLASNLFGLLLLYTHPFIFYPYLGGLIPVSILMMYRKRSIFRDMEVRWILASLLFFTPFLILSGSASSGFSILISLLASAKTGPFTGYTFLSGGFTSNLVLLSLAAWGALKSKGQSVPWLYLTALTTVSGVGFLFLNDVYRLRLLMNLPLGLFASVGLVAILNRSSSRRFRSTIYAFVVGSMLVYLLRSLANLI